MRRARKPQKGAVATLRARAACHGARTPIRDRVGTAMHLIQLFLPLYDNEGEAFPKNLYDTVRGELTDRFGGVTAFLRAPAVGAWEDDGGAVQRDEVVLFEVMAPHVDHGWWATYREALEQRFRQDEVLIRASAVERL